MKYAVLAAAGLVLLAVGGVLLLLHQVQAAPPRPLRLQPALVVQGSQTSVSESGFFPEEPVDFRVTDPPAPPSTNGHQTAPAPLELGQSRASLRGRITDTLVTLPPGLTSGIYHLEAVGAISGRTSQVKLYVQAKSPWVTLPQTQLKPHLHFGLIAGGFQPGEKVVVSMEPANGAGGKSPSPAPPVMGSLPTNQVGNTSFIEVKDPYLQTGDFTVIVRGSVSGKTAEQAVHVVPYQPDVQLSPWSGPPGVKVNLNGRGFAPDETIHMYFGSSTQPAATFTADQYGNFWGSGGGRVPLAVRPGNLVIRVVGQDSEVTVDRGFNVLELKPWLNLSSYWGAPSAPVEFSGGGWDAGEKIAFHVGSAKAPVVATGQADDYGWLHQAGPAYVPRDAPATVTFVAVGERSGRVATATFKVNYPFGLGPGGVFVPTPTPLGPGAAG